MLHLKVKPFIVGAKEWSREVIWVFILLQLFMFYTALRNNNIGDPA